MLPMLTIDHLRHALSSANDTCKANAIAGLQNLHAGRSRAWVRCLAEQLEELSPGPNVAVLYKGKKSGYSAQLGLTELLYDVTVCETANCAAVNGNSLTFVKRALWLVESEFARDSFQAVKDFNKLVIGSAENKLFVGPRLTDPAREAQYRATLAHPAACCQPDPYLAIVPHPDAWDPMREGEVELFRFTKGEWNPVR